MQTKMHGQNPSIISTSVESSTMSTVGIKNLNIEATVVSLSTFLETNKDITYKLKYFPGRRSQTALIKEKACLRRTHPGRIPTSTSKPFLYFYFAIKSFFILNGRMKQVKTGKDLTKHFYIFFISYVTVRQLIVNKILKLSVIVYDFNYDYHNKPELYPEKFYIFGTLKRKRIIISCIQ